MFINLEYNRKNVVSYAEKWAHSRNSKFLDFDGMGGDCTNFVSQCIYAGCNTMNYTKVFGWYYNSANDRSPSWSGVKYLYNFLIDDKGAGPYAKELDRSNPEGLMPGDVIQLGDGTGRFYHSLIVINLYKGEIYVATHTFDSLMRPLSSYVYEDIRFIHIAGCRKWV